MLYAIGDIHGEVKLLEDLLEKVPSKKDDRFVFVGDYVDRGSDSKGVVDLLIDEQSLALAELEAFIGVPIRLQGEYMYNQEQYDVVLV